MPAFPSTTQSLHRLVQFVLLRNGNYVTQWTFLIPPDSHEQEEPVRQDTQRTYAGGYSDLFGPDLPTITIEGTTGYDIRRLENGIETDGYEHWLAFLTQIFRIFINKAIEDDGSEYLLHYYNWTHRQYYSVMPLAVTWDMAVPENTVFYYHIELSGLEPLLQPRTIGYSLSFETIVSNATTNVVNTAIQGVQHTNMALTLLQLGGFPT